jgi:hypothetical protein
MPRRTPQPLDTLAGHFEAAGFDRALLRARCGAPAVFGALAAFWADIAVSLRVWNFQFG